MIVLLIVPAIVITLLVSYVILQIRFNDMTVPNLKLIKSGNVLVIYPHPDDELSFSGGLINKLANKKDINLYVISTTCGEHGDEVLKLPPDELGKVRINEFTEVMNTLGVKNFNLWDFTDGGMPAQKAKLKERLSEFIKKYKIDLVVTYEKFGLYGHPDHIILSKVVNEISKELDFQVLYSTLPKKILEKIELPKTLTYEDRVVDLKLDEIATPEYKLNITTNLPERYEASKKYKSQNITRGRPLWLINLFTNYEYYTSKYE